MTTTTTTPALLELTLTGALDLSARQDTVARIARYGLAAIDAAIAIFEPRARSAESNRQACHVLQSARAIALTGQEA